MRTSKLALAVITIGLAVSSALAADAADRRFLRDGMSEGEVLMKVGKPDSESEDSGGGAKVMVSFDERFVELARRVYRTNDERAARKRQIDELVGSELREHKSHALPTLP